MYNHPVLYSTSCSVSSTERDLFFRSNSPFRDDTQGMTDLFNRLVRGSTDADAHPNVDHVPDFTDSELAERIRVSSFVMKGFVLRGFLRCMIFVLCPKTWLSVLLITEVDVLFFS